MGLNSVAGEGFQRQHMKYCEAALLALLDLGEKSGFLQSRPGLQAKSLQY